MTRLVDVYSVDNARELYFEIIYGERCCAPWQPPSTHVVFISGPHNTEESAIASEISACLEEKDIKHLWFQQRHMDSLRPTGKSEDEFWLEYLRVTWEAAIKEQDYQLILLDGFRMIQRPELVENALRSIHEGETNDKDGHHPSRTYSMFGFHFHGPPPPSSPDDARERREMAANPRPPVPYRDPKEYQRWTHFQRPFHDEKGSRVVAQQVCDVVIRTCSRWHKQFCPLEPEARFTVEGYAERLQRPR